MKSLRGMLINGRPLSRDAAKPLLLTLAVSLVAPGFGCDFSPPEAHEEQSIVSHGGPGGGWSESGVGGEDGGSAMGGLGTVMASLWSAQAPTWSMTPSVGSGTDEAGNPTKVLRWGYKLAYSNIILSPDGSTLLMLVPAPGPDEGFEEPMLLLAAQPLPSGPIQLFPEFRNILRINFSPDGSKAYVLQQEGRRLTEIDLRELVVLRSVELPLPFSTLDVSQDGRYVFASNLPRTPVEQALYRFNSGCVPQAIYSMPKGTDLCRVEILDLQTGYLWNTQLPQAARDLDYLVTSRQLVLTYGIPMDAEERNRSVLQFYSLDDKRQESSLLIPNCSDELVLSRDQTIALLSPTFCAFVGAGEDVSGWVTTWQQEEAEEEPDPPESKDPISLIDLTGKQFVQNYPGFGPVMLSPNGRFAGGFTRRSLMESGWNFFEQLRPFGLVLVDLITGGWKVHDFGEVIPAYFFSPDSRSLIAYGYWSICTCMNTGGSWDECGGSSYRECRASCCDTCCSLTIESALKFYPTQTGGPAGSVVWLPEKPMRHYAWSGDGKTLFAMFDDEVLPVENADSFERRVGDALPLGDEFQLFKARQQGDLLVFAKSDRPEVVLYDMKEGGVGQSLDLNVLGALIK